MIIVTGGLGFIGKNLSSKLEKIDSLNKEICIVDKKKEYKSKKFT